MTTEFNSNRNELHVIFGAGPVGLSLADELLSRGKRVRLANRKGSAPAPKEVEVLAVDAMDARAVAETCKGATAAYHCMNVPYPAQVELIPKLQKSVIAGVAESGAKLIVVDSLYMYGETKGKPMNETSPHSATSRKGRMRSEVAHNYLLAHNEGKVRVSIGRAADFYGPRVMQSSFGYLVFPLAVSGKSVQVLGNIDLPHSYSYILDVAKGLATLGEEDAALGKDWLLPVAQAVTTRQMVALLSQALGRKVGIMAVPKLAVQAIGLVDPMMREMVEMMYQFYEPQIVDSGRFENAFGWTATPLAEGIATTVGAFQQAAR